MIHTYHYMPRVYAQLHVMFDCVCYTSHWTVCVLQITFDCVCATGHIATQALLVYVYTQALLVYAQLQVTVVVLLRV